MTDQVKLKNSGQNKTDVEIALAFMSKQTREIISNKIEIKECYKHGNETQAELEKLLSFNNTESSCLQVVDELNKCQTECDVNRIEADKQVVGEYISQIAAQNQAYSSCNGYSYLSKKVLCPLENFGNYVNDNIWSPIPMTVKYVIVVGAVAATGYGIYSYFTPPIVEQVVIENPAVNNVVQQVVENIVVNNGVNPAQIQAAFNLAANIPARATKLFPKEAIDYTKTHIGNIEELIQYYQEKRITVDTLNTRVEGLTDYISSFGGEAGQAFVGAIVE